MSAILQSPALQLPLKADKHGSIRVGGTRVTLEVLLHFYNNGESAEQLAENFPTLNLGDIHAVIAFYLTNVAQVDEYLRDREAKAEEIRRDIESRYDGKEIRKRILARQAKTKP